MKRQGVWMWLSAAGLFAWMAVSGGPIHTYISYVKQHPGQIDTFGLPEDDAVPVFASTEAVSTSENPELMARIRLEAEKRRIAPIDAKVDRVWKAIPGYNGLEVDVERTYLLAKQRPKNTEPLFVYREVAPKVSLDDLGPQPIYRGNPKKPMISLMINVAWGDEFLPSMIDILNKQNVHATFFFDGSWLSKHLDMAKTIGAAGNELSNHAYSHPDMSKLSSAKQLEQIERTQKLLENELGVHNRLFAPPSGDYNAETVRIAHEMGLRTVLWTIDTVDWMKPSPQTILRKVSAKLEPGAMILMHPTQSSRDALDGMIREIKRRGFAIGTVSELLSSNRVSESASDPTLAWNSAYAQ